RGSAASVPCWACWKRKPTPSKPGSLIKRIERAVMDGHLLAQVRVANPQEQIEMEDVKGTLAACTWFAAGNKNTKRIIHSRRRWSALPWSGSWGFKPLLRNVPLMKRQVA
ncbi:hypothetical protein GGI23_006434, partial [Coemansia sp. RSA 2559]